MAGDWLKIECGTPDKPEVFEIASELKITPAEAFGRLFLVWRLFDQRTEDGNAPSVTAAFVDFVAGVQGFAAAMRKVGWLKGGEAGLPGISLPEFDHHNGKTAKSRVLSARRQMTLRSRAGNAEVTQTKRTSNAGAVTKRIEEVNLNTAPDKPGIKTLIELGVSEQIAKDWLAVRKAKRAPLTDTVLDELKQEASKAGITVQEAVAICARRSWQGFKASWNWREEPTQAAPGERRAVV